MTTFTKVPHNGVGQAIIYLVHFHHEKSSGEWPQNWTECFVSEDDAVEAVMMGAG